MWTAIVCVVNIFCDNETVTTVINDKHVQFETFKLITHNSYLIRMESVGGSQYVCLQCSRNGVGLPLSVSPLFYWIFSEENSQL